MNKKENITLRQAFWYFIIFSIVGLFIETLYCYITTGVIESRKGLILGPFCPVYGVGATVLIFIANQFKGEHLKVFFYGALLGSFVEYILSFILEAIYGIRFWEYSYLQFNLNGRICILYSIFWGFLSLILIQVVVPFINKVINKIPFKKCIDICLFIFLLIDCVATVWGITVYQKRTLQITSNKPDFITNIENKLFSDKFMVKAFPNLRIITDNGEEIFIKDLIEDV